MDWQGLYNEMKDAQFSDKRRAVLLKRGVYDDADIGVGYYTSIMGVGTTRNDVTVKSFYSHDELYGQATCNFWRSVEGVVSTSTVNWATSQACPLRRTIVEGDLHLSEKGYSSGGFLGDVVVKGHTSLGTQQQFFFRNSNFKQGVSTDGARVAVFVGTENDGQNPSVQISKIDVVPRVAEKPFLVETDGDWHIAVPDYKTDSSGPSDDTVDHKIPMSDVYVAREQDTAATINEGIKGKKALLLTPAVYGLDVPIRISQDGFVVLGLGFPTLVAHDGKAALQVEATDVRIAMVLLEAGTSTEVENTDALLLWKGSAGQMSDVFSRAGAFSYARSYKPSCRTTRADVHIQVDGDNVIVDNTWLWHADHDDCGGRSDTSFSGNGLLVNGDDVTTYGLKVEHMMHNLVQWNGERGKVFHYQSELPYHRPAFGSEGRVGYGVSYGVREHSAVGLGIYIVYDQLHGVTAIRAPSSASITNSMIWSITGSIDQFAHMVCMASDVGAKESCIWGSQCSGNTCYLPRLPTPSPQQADIWT